MNINLEYLSQWLRANKLSFNVTKTEMIIFDSSSKKTDHRIKYKVDGERLTQNDTVKYLGVLLDDHLL